jgi:hypothetical protein
MPAKKIPDSVIRAFIERHQMPSVSIVIDDLDSVRVDPAAAGSPTPPSLRDVRRKLAGEPRGAAQDFADNLNGVVERTISDSRLSLIEVPGDRSAFELTRLVDGASAPLEFDGTTARLFVQQVFVVEDGDCITDSYSYLLQEDASIESWRLRWDYCRDPPPAESANAGGYVRVNGTWINGEPASTQRVLTGETPLELVVWFLISDWGAKPRSEDWKAILEESLKGFEARGRNDRLLKA